MSGYLKETLASVPQHLQSLQSLQIRPYLRNVRLPQFQLPQTDFQGRASKLHSRNPKASIIFLVLVFLFFWKDIIYNVGTHVTGPHKAASIVDNSPIRNSTLGVSSTPSALQYAGLIKSSVPRYFRALTARTRRQEKAPPSRRQCNEPHYNGAGRYKRQTNPTI